MKNIFRGIVTTLFGTIILGLTSFLVYKQSINFKWEGSLGIGLGLILLFAPDNIVQVIANVITQVVGRNKEESA